MNEPALASLPRPSALLLRVDDGGVVRVGKSRVSLDLIVEQYENGMTPEEMVAAYDTLQLSEIHGAIAYFLQHVDEVRQYLQRRSSEAAELKAGIDAQRSALSRAELLTRRAALEQDRAAARQ